MSVQKILPVHLPEHGQNGIDFYDFRRMQTITKTFGKEPIWRRGKPIPDFVFDRRKLQEVITLVMENRAFGSRKKKAVQGLSLKRRLVRSQNKLNDLRSGKIKTLDWLCTVYVEAKRLGDTAAASRLASQIEAMDSTLRTDENAARYVAAIIYMSFLLNMRSPEIGKEIGLKPCQIRQILRRVRVVWERQQCRKSIT